MENRKLRKVVTLDDFPDCQECSFPIPEGYAYKFPKGFTHPECGKPYGIATGQDSQEYNLVELQYRAPQMAKAPQMA